MPQEVITIDYYITGSDVIGVHYLFLWLFLKSGFYDISDEFVRNEKEYESGMLCKNCYSRNKRLLDIPKKKVMDANDITWQNAHNCFETNYI
jgi:hypothetical protein